MGRVSLVRYRGSMEESLSRLLELIGGLEEFVQPGDRVLVKPNLNGVEGCTDIALTETLLGMLFDLGARPFLAEATFGGAGMTRMFFQKTGYADLAARRGVRLVNLNESEAVEVKVARPLVAERIRVAREVFEAEKIVNLPNMKVHYATGITLAMKNLKGLLVGDEKRRFHEIGLDEAIVDLNNTIRPDLNIVDAINCMEKMGPRGGEPVKLDLLLAGASAAEVDRVGMEVMGYALEEVRHLDRYLEMNGIDPEGIETAGEKVEAVRRPFKKVRLDTVIPGTLRVRALDACSACMNAFLLSCSLLDPVPEEEFEVCMGARIPENPGTGKRVAFGNCCPEKGGFDISIPGCPPYPFALKERLPGGNR